MEKKVPIEVKGSVEILLNDDLYQLSIEEARELMTKLKSILEPNWWYPYPYPWSYTTTDNTIGVRRLPDNSGTPGIFPGTITCSSDHA